MPLQKNQVLTLTIERLSNDGSGVAHSPGRRGRVHTRHRPRVTLPPSASSKIAAATLSVFWMPFRLPRLTVSR